MEPGYLLYLEVSPHWTPVCNVEEMPLGGVNDNYLEPPLEGY